MYYTFLDFIVCTAYFNIAILCNLVVMSLLLSFAVEALNYSQIIMTVVFGPRTKQHQIVITRSFILVSIIVLFAVSLTSEQYILWAVRPNR